MSSCLLQFHTDVITVSLYYALHLYNTFYAPD